MIIGERYELVRLIGSGGMAEVFEGVKHGANGFARRVAIKRLIPDHADDPQLQRMFLDEARIASQLHHANIVQVLDYGTVEGAQFIVMEHVNGLTVSAAARRSYQLGEAIPASIALYICAQIAHALDYSHGRRDAAAQPLGIVHRDVSPSNMLLSWEGDVKLTDFGIALASSRETRTRTGVVKGKEYYMAPEQARGEPVDSSADIYALGVSLHWILTGTTTAGANLRGAALPLEVEQLIERSTARQPGLRPGASQFAEQADRCRKQLSELDGRTELARWLRLLADDESRRPRRPGAFDRMMGVFLVPAEGGSREFTVSQVRTNTSLASTSSAGGPTAPARRKTPKGVANSPRRRLALAVVLLGLGGGALAGVWIVADRSAGETKSVPSVTAVEAPARDLGISDISSSTLSDGRARDIGAREGMTDGAVPDLARSRRKQAPRRNRPGRVAPSSHDGWLRVGGAALLRGIVYVDGIERGRAPSELRLRVGGHYLVVKNDGGEILLERQLVVSETHRRATPLRVILHAHRSRSGAP